MRGARTSILIALVVVAATMEIGVVRADIALQQACAADVAFSGPARRQVPDDVWRRDFTRPIDGALPPALEAALEGVVDDLARRAPAVSVAVAIPGVGRWSALLGADNSRFQAASTTKTLTAAAVLQLEAEGKLSLSQSIESWFPDAPNARVTTVDHLLRHTSGLVSFNALPAWTLDFRPPREAIAMATAEPALFCPGTHFAYSNTGYAMLGVILETIEGRPLHEIFAERFIAPLGLAHTSLRHRDDDVPVVAGHVGGKPADVPDGYATPFAAGSLASTAEDLVTFWHALLGGRAVPLEIARAMFTDLAPMDAGGQMFYGRGVQLYDIPQGPGLMLGHSGGITGFTSIVAYLASDDMYVSVIFNDQRVPAEAGLWAVVRAVRAARAPAADGGIISR